MSDDDGLKITLAGKQYALEDFELGELEWLEDELGVVFGDLDVDDRRKLTSMKATVRFVYIIKKRDDPEFTLDDARKLKLDIFVEDEPAEERPTRPARKPAGSTRAKSGATS